MFDIIFRDATMINEGMIHQGDLGVKGGRIEKIAGTIHTIGRKEIDATGLWLMPGIIDDQVHFREPGLTHKATIGSESRAAVAGGVTSFMEMPNTNPPAITQELLEEKYAIARKVSPANYSFYMGASNENLEEVLRTDPSEVCGVKVFMGSSTGNMLVDDQVVLEKIFSQVPMLIATHCEDEEVIRRNTALYKDKYGESLSAIHHPAIRSSEGCYLSSSKAVALAKKHNARLHVLHISAAVEIPLFYSDLSLDQKQITSEVCVHHLYFSSTDYPEKGNKIKCNPAIKSLSDRAALREALVNGVFDVIATDHAPHTLTEKEQPYLSAPSGLPLIQHSLSMMLSLVQQEILTLEMVVEKMCHAPAVCFNIIDRGYLREGYFADIVLVDPNEAWTVSQQNILYKCGWSPLEGTTFKGRVKKAIVNGEVVYQNGKTRDVLAGKRLRFLNKS